MITVIIPALNEEKTIGFVIETTKKSANVSEIIVVDDKSEDRTIEIAKKHGCKVITSSKLGKGTSMKDGVMVAKNEIIAFLDADITTYTENIIDLLTLPIVENKADFVKSYFTRQAGRVTELVAKPLLSILYPNFPVFKQPLSGMIAGKKEHFSKIDFEEGYGVDIGILLDMFQMKVRIEEINIGHIENRMQSVEALGQMSRQVASVILKKSKNMGFQDLKTYEHIQVIREQMDFALSENLRKLKKIAILDMDNTITRGSFIRTAAIAFDFTEQLQEIGRTQTNPILRTKQIAKLLRGKSLKELLDVADSIKITPNALTLVENLKQSGYIVGIISDSYDCITNHLKNKLGVDFSLANELEFSRSHATGEVKIPSFFLPHQHSICKHDYCKSHALAHICEHYDISLTDTMMIGDGENDICLTNKASVGISFCSTDKRLDRVADYVIKRPDFQEVINYLF